MKFLLLALIPTLSFAQSAATERMQHILSAPKCSGDCAGTGLASGVKPTIKKAEAKITLPCEAEAKLPLGKKEEETITFHEPANTRGSYPLNDRGLILRSRVNKQDPSKSDVTIKFRPKVGDLLVDQEVYNKLKAQSDAAETANPDSPAIDFKCEADVSYGQDGNTGGDSCQITTTTADITEVHHQFLELIGTQHGPLPLPSLANYRKVSIEATSWKIDVVKANAQITDPALQFKSKKISLEKWLVNGVCIMEASVKSKPADIDADIKDLLTGFKALGFNPDAEVQGQKTKKAFEAAPAGWTKLKK